MTEERSLSWLEKKAVEATKLSCFNSINIHEIKDTLEKILREFGKNGFFSEYTTHDISHIDGLLNICDKWLINNHTKENLTLADALIITLAIYFHDAALVVTEDEFNNRGSTIFESFKREMLFTGEGEQDYQKSVQRNIVDEVKREKFYYQEFVRYYHGERIKSWLEGSDKKDLGVSAVKDVIQDIIGRMTDQFRSDLGLVCLSHHLDDLGNTKRYSLDRPYDNHKEAEANLQYAAVVLRTADLMHITKDRAPSISFRLINPKNPYSQTEWYKQNAVTSIREKIEISEDDKPKQIDTLEVHARFKEAEGYFGLDQYLTYAETQLRLSHKWIEASKAQTGGKYLFPWKNIDKEHIQADGFIKEQFSFRMDEGKILDLLTGYTLYNDPNIALRELVQNSLDAIKLQSYDSADAKNAKYKITIEWNPNNREFRITDNGTGMSQYIIENHFLKAGSSMYQEEEFKKTHPEFNSISRFGIGVLSCFMISDEITVTTSHNNDSEARELSLRSVHGSYLIKLKEKSNLYPEQIRKNGTSIFLRIRDSIDGFDVENILRYWIVFPHCEVELKIEEKILKIGFSNTEEAINHVLESMGLDPKTNSEVKIINIIEDDFSFSFATEYDKYFKYSTFVEIDEHAHNWMRKQPICTCVEGIRIESGTPGFSEYLIPAISNSTGLSAPKTNVARSGLEISKESSHLFSRIYHSLAENVSNEVIGLKKEPNISLSRAVDEAYWMMRPFSLNGKANAINSGAFVNSLKNIPTVLIDIDKERKNISIADLQNLDIFWTIEWDFMDSINSFIKNAPISISDSQISSILDEMEEGVRLPAEPRLVTTSYSSLPYSYIYDEHECYQIIVNQSLPRVDISWKKKARENNWVVTEVNGVRGRNGSKKIFVGPPDAFQGIEGYIGVESFGNIYISSASVLGEKIADAIRNRDNKDIKRRKQDEMLIRVIFDIGFGFGNTTEDIREFLRRNYQQNFAERAPNEIIEELVEAFSNGEKLFDPKMHKRREEII